MPSNENPSEEERPTRPVSPPSLPTEALSPGPGQGHFWRPLPAEEMDLLLEGFRVRALIGAGAMGAVYEAVQENLDRVVAIKVLPPELGSDPEFEARFRREARSMAKLNHPNIIQIFDFDLTSSGHYYLVMEFVDGFDLHHHIRQGDLSVDEIMTIGMQVCDALHFAHEQGFVHRDIKPANILLTRDHRVKVGDFGLAKLINPKGGQPDPVQENLTRTGFAIGTPNYVAPERLLSESEKDDHRADLYSLGVVFHELLTGTIPRGKFTPPSGKIKIDRKIDDIIYRALEEDPDTRYQKANEIRRDLEVVLRRKVMTRGALIGTRVFWVALGILIAGGGVGAWGLLGTSGAAVDGTVGGSTPDQWGPQTPVVELLTFLGEEKPPHFFANPDEEKSREGASLISEGRLASGTKAGTPLISHYFRCTDCHNTVREDSLLSSPDPEKRLAYALEKDIPLLPASSFAGIVNRESWFNGDYLDLIDPIPGGPSAHSDLAKAIDFCAREFARGRNLEAWEVEAILSYLWTLQWRVKDLGVTGEKLADWKRRSLIERERAALVSEIRDRFVSRSPATFGDLPADPESGLPIDREPDPLMGRMVFRQGCLHCHDPAEGAADTYFRDSEKFHRELTLQFLQDSENSVYGHIRRGTFQAGEDGLFMPRFPRERLSDFQIESLKAYLAE